MKSVSDRSASLFSTGSAAADGVVAPWTSSPDGRGDVSRSQQQEQPQQQEQEQEQQQ